MKTPTKIRPKTTPVLEALQMHKIFGDKITAIQEARTIYKTNPKVKLYESPTGKFIVSSNQDLGYKEIDFVKVSIVALRNYDVESMDELRDEQKVVPRFMRERYA